MRGLRTAGVAGLLSVLAAAMAVPARAQFEVPANSLSFEDSGTLEAIEGNLIKIRDSKNDLWILKLNDATAVTVEGTAEREVLRATLYVQLTGEIDRKGELQEPLEEIEIIPPQEKAAVGLFAEDDVEGAKPVKQLTAGTYRIKGRLAVYKEGQFLVMAGKHKITGKVSPDELEVKLKVTDLSLAQLGDEVKAKAWYYDNQRPFGGNPGSALAEEVVVTLAKPLEHTGKKPRAAPRASRPTAKSRLPE
jgi:hypothetical protein